MFRPLPPYIKIGKSKIEGKGLILKDEDLNANTIIGLFHYKVNKNLIIRTPLGGFCNHSETPNCEKLQSGRKFYLVSKKKIKVGEELTIKYDLYKP